MMELEPYHPDGYDHEILDYVKKHPGATLCEISRRMGMLIIHAKPRVERLEMHGYVCFEHRRTRHDVFINRRDADGSD